MNPKRSWMLAPALVLALMGAPARAADTGPYAVAALGITSYDYDCYFFSDCDRRHATAARVGGGYRWGVFALEGWLTDHGRASIPGQGGLRLRSAAVTGAWYLRMGQNVQGLLRAGAAQVRHTRSNDGSTDHLEGLIGLGLVVDLSAPLALELAWDATTAEGRNTGSVLAQTFSLGLRVRF